MLIHLKIGIRNDVDISRPILFVERDHAAVCKYVSERETTTESRDVNDCMHLSLSCPEGRVTVRSTCLDAHTP